MLVMHIISGLNIGGAELMLKRLIQSTPINMHRSIVVSLTELGSIGKSLQEDGISVFTLGMTSVKDFPASLWRLTSLIRIYKPDIIQTWMYHADFIGGLSARIAGHKKIIWNIRSTAIPQGYRSLTYWLIRICAITSSIIPSRIICNAISAKTAHIKLKYSANRLIVIFNGYKFSELCYDKNLRYKSRKFLGFNDSDIVIGVMGRFDPLKDFNNFVKAASCLIKEFSRAKFLMVGRGNDSSNSTLKKWIRIANLEHCFYLVGEQVDVNYYLASMDIFCLSSSNEAFPNVVVEAMAAGLPCVVTRAGDAAEILNDENFVVEVKDPISLAKKLLVLCNLSEYDRENIGKKNANKVRESFGIEKIRDQYIEVYLEVLRNE